MRRDLTRQLDESRKAILEARHVSEGAKKRATDCEERANKAEEAADEARRELDEIRKRADETQRTVDTLRTDKERAVTALMDIRKDRDLLIRERDEMRTMNTVLTKEVEDNQATIRRLYQELIDTKENIIRDYKQSEAFADDLAEESIGVYLDGFTECQEKVQELLPNFDVTRLVSCLSNSSVEKEIAEAAGAETSGLAEEEEGIGLQNTEEIEVIHIDTSSPDQVDEEPAEKIASEGTTEEFIPEVVPTLSRQDTTPAADEIPTDGLPEA